MAAEIKHCLICLRPVASSKLESACEGSGGRLCYQLGYSLVRLELCAVKARLAELLPKVDAAIESLPRDYEEGGDGG